jgi:proteasome lid subunit RPN8/RPN11
MGPGYLDERDLDEIYRIGQERAPVEACGLLLPRPVPDNHPAVVELPNAATDPTRAFLLNPRQAPAWVHALLQREDIDDDWFEGVAFWHTHPRGMVGPSEVDMSGKVVYVDHYLVVALTPTGPQATWY